MIGKAIDGDIGDARIGQQAQLDVLGVGLQRDRVIRPGDGDGDHRIGSAYLRDHGGFDLLGEIIDGIDGSVDIIHKHHHVAAFDHHRGGLADALGGFADHLIQIGDALQSILQATADGVLHILGAGAGVDDLDADLVVLDAREGFALQVGQADQAENDDRQHGQVGGGRVLGKPFDHGVILPARCGRSQAA